MEAVAHFDRAAMRRLRVGQKMSHGSLGRLIGVHRILVTAYEKGGPRPSPGRMVALASALGVHPFELMTVSGGDASLADSASSGWDQSSGGGKETGNFAEHVCDICGSRAGRGVFVDLVEGLADALGVTSGLVMAAYQRGQRPSAQGRT